MKSISITRRQLSCKVYCRIVSSTAQPDSLTQIFAARDNPAVLGGNPTALWSDRFSIWAAEPIEIFEFHQEDADPFAGLNQALDKYRLAGRLPGGLPAGLFCGGWIGYFAYELGRYVEKLPDNAVDDIKLPIIRLCFYDKAICYDHTEQRWLLTAMDMPGMNESASEKLAGLEQILKKAQNISVPSGLSGCIDSTEISSVPCNMTDAAYLDAVKKIHRCIYDGEVYQVNFSRRFQCDYDADPVQLYHWQNRYNPCPYSAYIAGSDFAVVSASPEMFITVIDGFIRTQPIKGTRPRVSQCADAGLVNRHAFEELAASEKDQAELNMIIDLERNDLARICQPGTRHLIQPRSIEAYPTVFHALATIGGKLNRWKRLSDICEVLKAVFPGGSITGAPKIRAMEIIDQLEPTQRSVYTGSVGFLALDGTVCLNIAIRTVIIKNKTAFVQTGGGIVADSDPRAELDETSVKAKAPLAGIAAIRNSLKK